MAAGRTEHQRCWVTSSFVVVQQIPSDPISRLLLPCTLQLIWVPNQTGYITARDLDAATARHIKQYIQQQQQQKNDGHGCVHEEQHEQPQQEATAVASVDGWQLVPYGVTPALQQWMAEHQVSEPCVIIHAPTSPFQSLKPTPTHHMAYVVLIGDFQEQ